jgi:bacterioferritin (cytochrome b1)
VERSGALRKFLKEIWDSFRKYLKTNNQEYLVEILSQEYIEKSENVVKFTQYASHMVYPQYRDQLLRICDEEQQSIRWLAEQITALGGELPQVYFSPRPAKNAWERLRTVLDKKQRHGSDQIHRLLQLDGIDPRIAQEVRRMRQQDELHRQKIQAMMMRSDPQAGWLSKGSSS